MEAAQELADAKALLRCERDARVVVSARCGALARHAMQKLILRLSTAPQRRLDQRLSCKAVSNVDKDEGTSLVEYWLIAVR